MRSLSWRIRCCVVHRTKKYINLVLMAEILKPKSKGLSAVIVLKDKSDNYNDATEVKEINFKKKGLIVRVCRKITCLHEDCVSESASNGNFNVFEHRGGVVYGTYIISICMCSSDRCICYRMVTC